MSILRKKELKKMNDDDVVSRLSELRLELAKENAQVAVGGTPSNAGKMKETRRTIARMLTEQRIRKGGSKAGRNM